MSYLFAICDKQEAYVSKLAEYFNVRKAIPFKVIAFSSVDKLIEYENHTHIELLLITEELFVTNRQYLSAAHIVLLNESGQELVEGYHVIYKYQSAERIMKQLLHIYGEIGDPAVLTLTGRKVELIGVYSPIRRCLQTSFALTLGQIMAKKRKTLYLNFEPFSGFSGLMMRTYEHDLMDLLYFLGNGMEKFIYKMQSMIESIGDLDYLPPAMSFIDLVQMEDPTIVRFLEEIAVRTEYEVVVMDLTDNLRNLFDILSGCSRIYTITRDDRMAQAKLQQYRQLLEFMQKDDILTHTKMLTLPVFEQIPARLEQLPYSGIADYIQQVLLKEES